MINDRINNLRALFAEHQIDGYIIPSVDEYMSEYVPNYAKRLEYITGFTGSNGVAVILKNNVLFFTDGRYLEQSKQQLPPSLFSIFDLGQTKTVMLNLFQHFNGSGEILKQVQHDASRGPGEILNQVQDDGQIQHDAFDNSVLKVGYDPRLFTNKTLQLFQGIKLKAINNNLIDQIWQDQPAKPSSQAYIYDLEFAGQSHTDKIDICRQTLSKFSASSLVITAIDSICWLLNLRASDVKFSPIILGTVLVTKDNVYFFTNVTRLSEEVENSRDDITFLPEEELVQELSNLQGKVLIDENYASSFIMNLLSNHKIQKIDDPCKLPKACKNSVEIQHAVDSHIKDAVALCEFLSELQTITSITEYDLALILTNLRAKQPRYIMDSFATICGFRENSAIMHYCATIENAKVISGDGMLLIDSGGQYLGCTTDVTRTISIGEPTDLQKRRYTQVLKGHIALGTARFPANTTGSNLDILARQFLWQEAEDYAHGTGHGVGSFLSVHEGPQAINQRSLVPLKPGMILSNEPGFYIPGDFGIRIENLMYVKLSDHHNFMEFKQLTLVPYAKELIDADLLTNNELAYIKNYYHKIKNLVYPLLSDKAKEWLIDQIIIFL